MCALLQLGAPPSRTTSNLGSPGSAPGTPVLTTGGSPSPLGMSSGHGFAPSPTGVPMTTPEQVRAQSAATGRLCFGEALVTCIGSCMRARFGPKTAAKGMITSSFVHRVLLHLG